LVIIYQHPLAYLHGLEGVALLRAFAGDYDRDFTEARLSEIRALLDSADQLGDGAETHPITTVEGYRAWAEDYDQPGTGLLTWSSQSFGRSWMAAQGADRLVGGGAGQSRGRGGGGGRWAPVPWRWPTVRTSA
jgi:hypothetical protein